MPAQAAAAVVAAQAAIAQGQRDTPAWLRLAAALQAARRWTDLDSAIEAARNAAKQAMDFALLGEFLGRLERHDEACTAYDQALAIDHDKPRYLFNGRPCDALSAGLKMPKAITTESSQSIHLMSRPGATALNCAPKPWTAITLKHC